MLRWLKTNPTLASGIFLPVIVMAFFALAEMLPQQFGEAPKYDLLLAEIQNGQPGNSYMARTDNGRITTEFMTHTINMHSYNLGNDLHIYRVHTADMTAQEITYTRPDISVTDADDKWHPFSPPELAKYRISGKDTSPDGFRYQWGPGNGGGEMFLFSGGYNTEGVIEKNGRRLRVPQLGVNRWQQPVFLGWILPTVEMRMSTRDEAMAEIVALANEHKFSARDIGMAMNPALTPPSAVSTGSSKLTRLFGYLGGIFVFAGLSSYISMFWTEMNPAMRVIITLGTGFALFIIGINAARDERYRRIAAPLLFIAAFMQPGGMFVLVHEYFPPMLNPRLPCLIIFGVMFMQQGFAFVAARHAVLLCAAMGYASLFFATAFDMLHVQWHTSAVVIGISLLLVSHNYVRTKVAREVSVFWFAIGSITLLIGAFDMLEHTSVEVLYLGLTSFIIYLSVQMRETTLLAIGTIATLCYIGYFTEEHFAHSIGWPVSLVLLGIAFFACGGGALRIKRNYMATP